MRHLRLLLFPLLLLTAGCGTVLFDADFDGDAAGGRPTARVGRIDVTPGTGAVNVVNAPGPGAAQSKWVRVYRPDTQPRGPQTVMDCTLSARRGTGSYTLFATMYVQSGSGPATVQFEPSQLPDGYRNFLHLDFMPEGNVRINDNDAMRFGRFPHDLPFFLTVRLDITATAATAHITLTNRASGTIDVPLTGPRLADAQQFERVKFWMGYQWQGAFAMDGITISRRD